jgi:large subunit ribosomal protein L22
MKASLKNYRQSPRKVRLVADLVRGKKVSDALTQLRFLPKRASQAMSKLIASAQANAVDQNVGADNLVIKEITVDQGVTLKRIRPKARGMAHRINKRTSNINVTLGEK